MLLPSHFGCWFLVGGVVAEELNDRPRKALDWDTPAERLGALLGTSSSRPL